MAQKNFQIKGKNIQLRDWIIEDIPPYEKWLTGAHKWLEFDGPYYAKSTKEGAKEAALSLKKKIEKQAFPKVRNRVAIADINTNQLIGNISYYWESIETNWLCTGLVIFDENYWSKGLGFEAMGLWSQYLFDEIPEIVRLDMRTWSGNIGMMRLAEKLGFTLEARFRDARIVKGKYYDSIGYGILRKEWNTLYPKGFKNHI